MPSRCESSCPGGESVSSKRSECQARITDGALQYPRCDVALEAAACWHDVIKNRIQSYLDGTLAAWLEDSQALTDFEARLRRVVSEMDKYSPAVAASQLRPIVVMVEERRALLLARLDELFERGFGVAPRRQRLESIVEAFMLAVQAWKDAEGETRSEKLAGVRSAAADVRTELESLPSGFWLPAV